MSPDDPRHGTSAGGRVHRADNETVCAPCRRAEARYEQQLQLDRLAGRPRMVPAVGTRRRVQALVALGHSFNRIAEGLNITQAGAHAIAHRTGHLTRATTAARVAALYEAWSMTLPPQTTRVERRNATYARTVARRHSWPPPLAWDDIDNDPTPTTTESDRDDIDEAVVLRILAGDALPTTTAERRAIVARWHLTGRPLADLERLGWKPERYRTHDQDDAA